MSLWIVKCQVIFTSYIYETQSNKKLHLVEGDTEKDVQDKVKTKYVDMCEEHGDAYFVNILDCSEQF